MMATRVVTYDICDRCGSESVRDAPRAVGHESGSMTVAWEGYAESRSAMGDTAGRRYEGKAWLCYGCTRQFLEFMKDAPAVKFADLKGGRK